MEHPNPTTDTTLPAFTGLHGKPLLVQKEGAEGGLVIGSLSGQITQSIMERPEWSEGLATALIAERHGFYQSRLGHVPSPGILNFEDLGWVCVNAEGDEFQIEADAEFRMNVIASATGTVRTDDLSDKRLQEDTPGQQAYVLLDATHEYRHNEPAAVDLTWEEAVAAAAKVSRRATGTEG